MNRLQYQDKRIAQRLEVVRRLLRCHPCKKEIDTEMGTMAAPQTFMRNKNFEHGMEVPPEGIT